MTLLAVAQTLANRLQWTSPSTVIGNTNNNIVLMLALLNEVIDNIASEHRWPELNRDHSFRLIQNLDSYPLPADFDSHVEETWWNQGQHWPLIGPLTPQIWQQYTSGFITTLPRQRFRVSGIANNQFSFNPYPTSDEADQLCIFQYQSNIRRRPPQWVANTAYTTANYVFNNGLILKCSSNGTSSNTGSTPQAGVDGTIFWESVPVYVASVNYYVGQYVYVVATSRIYKVTTGGLSSAGTPSVSSGSETLGTVVFEFQATASSWAGGTEYEEGDFVINASSQAFRAAHDGMSGKFAPAFAVTLTNTSYPSATQTKTITDGTAAWVVQTTYPNFVLDTDEILLDDKIIVDETEWRILQDRGFDYLAKKEASDEQKEIAKSKKTGAGSISLNSAQGWPWAIGVWSYPLANFGGDS